MEVYFRCSSRLGVMQQTVPRRGDDGTLDRRNRQSLVLRSKARCAERDSSQGTRGAWICGHGDN